MQELRLLLAAAGFEKRVQHAKQQLGRGVLVGVLAFAFMVAFAVVITALLAATLFWALLPELAPAGAAGATAAVFLAVLVGVVFVAHRQMRVSPHDREGPAMRNDRPGEGTTFVAPNTVQGLVSLAVLGVLLGLSKRGSRQG